MARVFRLAKVTWSFTGAPSTSSSYDLLNWTNGLDLAENGYVQKMAGEEEQFVPEVINLVARATTHDGLGDVLRGLELFLKNVHDARIGANHDVVCLQVKLANSTKLLQAMIVDFRLGEVSYSSTALDDYDGYVHVPVQLAIRRVSLWEWAESGATLIESVFRASDFEVGNGQGGMLTTRRYETSGSAPGRLFGIGTLGSSPPITAWWAGIRSDRFGNPENFVPVWYLNSGYIPDADEAVISGGNVVVPYATTATATMTTRIVVQTRNVTSDYVDQSGVFLVLLRAWCSDGSTICRARIADGQSDTAYAHTKMSVRQRVVVSGSASRYYEMGTIQIPALGRHPSIYGYDPCQYYGIRVDSDRLSGSGNLVMDGLVMIPVAEGYASAQTDTNATSTGYLLAYEWPDGRKQAIRVGSAIEDSGNVKILGGVPPKTHSSYPIYIVIANAWGDMEMGASLPGFVAYYIPRFRSLANAS